MSVTNPRTPAVAAELGRRFRARREELGLTTREVAEACGVSQPTYTRWETGQNPPGLDQLIMVAVALQTTLPVLTEGIP